VILLILGFSAFIGLAGLGRAIRGDCGRTFVCPRLPQPAVGVRPEQPAPAPWPPNKIGPAPDEPGQAPPPPKERRSLIRRHRPFYHPI
jgi:hypothetical protein